MSGSIQMPKYKCHKEVWALKIEQVKPESAERVYLHFADKRYAPIEIDKDWIGKHKPSDGGYYVQYQDGYTSYSPAEAFESGYTAVENLEVPDPSKNELSVAFRLAAQISGIKDEVADFMAGLDGALMAGKSVEDLCDEIQERIALYDTPEAVDLFMQMTKGRSGVEIPELVKDVIQAPEGSEAKIIFTVETKDHNPGKSLVGHLGLALFEFNQDQVSCSNLEPRNPAELTDNQKACIGRAKEIPYVASNGFKVRWYNAAAIAEVMGNTKASNPLSGKYISANATVIDACQMPADGSLSGFTEWSDKVGFTEYNKMRLSSEGKTLEVSPGDWVVAYLNAEPGRMVFNSFEPEIFEALYTSAAELLK